MLAMLFMVVFTTLALAFYAQTTMSAQVAGNEERSNQAQIAAESGMRFIQYQLSQVKIPPMVPQENLLEELHMQLSDAMDGTGNLAGGLVGIDYASSIIHVPALASKPVALTPGGPGFRAALRQSGREFVITVTGSSAGGQLSRGIRQRFQPVPVNDSVFKYGVTARGKIKLGGDFDLEGEDSDIDGSMYSATIDEFKTPVEVKKRASLSGDLYLADTDGNIKVGDKVSIHGTTDPAVYNALYIHRGVKLPEFPQVDTAPFKAFATNTYAGGSKDKDGLDYYANVVIPPNTNPKFDKGTLIEGVLYIKMPNKVTFSEHTIVRGVIVVEKSANPKDYKDSKNKIEFKKGSTLYGIETLPASAQFPDALRNLTGASIIAPDTQVKFSGNSGAWAGSVVVEDMTFSGHATGKISGSVVSFGDVKFDKKGSLTFDRDADRRQMIAGLLVTTAYAPLPSSYEEVRP